MGFAPVRGILMPLCAPDDVARLAGIPDRNVAAAVMVAEDGRYLLQLRDDFPGLHLPGHWGLFGGSLEPGETAEAALRRELGEELGWQARETLPLAVSIHALLPEAPVFRMQFFTVPFRLAELDAMVQAEGAGKGLFTLAEAAALERISPWDLCALMFHGRRNALFPEGLPIRPPPL
jgi:8-oxo-dGTP pyrophosphatase MutT (NUDIX family)